MISCFIVSIELEAGGGSAVLKFGLNITFLSLTGLIPNNSSDLFTPSTRSLVEITATFVILFSVFYCFKICLL